MGEAKPKQRLDIQGLRMVAVMLVVLSHLFHWPRGGFIGVDVFFVISGFLITGSLLHTFEKTGKISFSNFYRRRIRRIVPIATLVLFATIVASYFIYTGARFKSTVLDAVAAFFFVSNWRFGIEGTDYFNSAGPVSPLQHYWSLSVEEQFYFVWPAVILATGIVVMRKSWSVRARLVLAAAVMGTAVLVSFWYSVLNTEGSPTWAYFSTLARVWELGVGALLAISIGYFERIPDWARPYIAWTGLIAIGAGAFAITETGGGFPAPWAAVPVLGAALVIAAGVSGDQKHLQILTNRGSTYIGDISYSLYLWHWPIIILLASLADRNNHYFAAALLLMFGISIASYHFFENPIRNSNWLATRKEKQERNLLAKSRWRLPTLRMSESNQTRGIVALALITAGLVAFTLAPVSPATAPPVRTAAPAIAAVTGKVVGPEQSKLAQSIASAVQATSWPELNPSMDAVIKGRQAPPDIVPCGLVDRPETTACIWGNPLAPRSIFVLGDSVAMTYVEPLRKFAEKSNGQWSVRSEAMFGCPFVDLELRAADDEIGAACPTRKASAIRSLNEIRPEVVVIANSYSDGANDKWAAGITRMTDQFAGNVGKIVFLSSPPDDVNIGECYNRVNSPADCISRVTGTWFERFTTEQYLADSLNGTFLDSRKWFCTPEDYCPSFVGTTPAKMDAKHMTPAYADLISPAFAEALLDALE
ncbi:acyltransferase family protein [Rhodococcus opacus]|nr:acyltransferase family protein [Rhodococcus opacus]